MGVKIEKMKHELFTWVSARIVSHLWIGAVRGLENVDVAGPSIVIANHSSYLDFLILGSLFEHHLDRRLHFFAKDKVFEHRLFRFYCRQFECLLVKNGHVSLDTWKLAIQRLRGGHMIGIFPEGTRSRTGDLLPFESGYLRLAQQARVPVLPITLTGTYRIWPPHQRLPKRIKSDIQVHAPFFLPEKVKKGELLEINQTIRNRYFRPLLCAV